MKKFRFFTLTYETLQDVRRHYYTLAKQFHPDKGGKVEDMQVINYEYEVISEMILNDAGGYYSNYSDQYKDFEMQYNAEMQAMIEKLINISLPGCFVEICGSWIWVSGNTRPVYMEIKSLGFRFCKVKVMWSWHPEAYRKRSKKRLSIDEIRALYGTHTVSMDKEERVKLS